MAAAPTRLMTKRQVKYSITNSFRRYMSAPVGRRFRAIPKTLTPGKMYEAYILGILARELTSKEGLTLKLVAGRRLRLRSSPGPIDRRFAHIDVLDAAGDKIAEIWTDIQFLTLSYAQRGSPNPIQKGDRHELDIVMVKPDHRDNPSYDSILLGVECKNTKYGKELLREILGVRRELSLLTGIPIKTCFKSWPQTLVRANPSSSLIVYTTSSDVHDYDTPGEVFGIRFFYEPL